MIGHLQDTEGCEVAESLWDSPTEIVVVKSPDKKTRNLWEVSIFFNEKSLVTVTTWENTNEYNTK